MADTNFKVNCPACGKEMKKFFIEEAGFNVDICIDGCGGLLFDNRELEKLEQSEEITDKVIELMKDRKFAETDTSATRVCPICKTPMVHMGSKNVNVKIDVCNKCGAKFLDNGELNAIKEGASSEEKFKDIAKDVANRVLRGI